MITNLTIYDPYAFPKKKEKFVHELFEWFSTEGNSSYDENVTQLEHALQSAQIARNENESDEDVVAALLHDVGHLLLHESRDNPDFLEKNLNHEDVAAEWLKLFFPSRVVGAVHGHVMAKRYLCAVDETYWNGLSEASKQSLRLQGGAMSELECSQFEKKPYFKSAIKLRKIDDRAKVAGAKTSPLSAYYEHVIQLYCADG